MLYIFRHLHNLIVSCNWQLEDVKAKQDVLQDELCRVRGENADIKAELDQLRKLYDDLLGEIRQIEAHNDVRAEIIVNDINESLATFADDVVDRVDRGAEGRRLESLYSEKVKKATQEMDSGLGAGLCATSTPVKAETFMFEAGEKIENATS